MATEEARPDPLADIRHYAAKIAERAGYGDPAVWAARAGVAEEAVQGFLEGGDVGLTDLVLLLRAADAFMLPMPSSREDETVILLEEERLYGIGVAPSPFDRYRDLDNASESASTPVTPPPLSAAWLVCPGNRLPGQKGDDRILANPEAGFFALADGATGWGYGGQAADAALASVGGIVAADPASALDVTVLMADTAVAAALNGEGATTLVAFRVDGTRVRGASAGDSRLVAFTPNERVELTGGQRRKPRVGSGCHAIPFERDFPVGATLVAASDGLWDFTTARAIEDAVRQPGRSPTEITADLERLVREQNGGEPPDDLSVIVVVVGGSVPA